MQEKWTSIVEPDFMAKSRMQKTRNTDGHLDVIAKINAGNTKQLQNKCSNIGHMCKFLAI